jgi:hypothetical protein
MYNISMANIQGDNYRVWYEGKNNTVYFEGTLRLGTIAEYSPIIQLLTNVANDSSDLLNINFNKLYSLNSSGISIISKFIVDIRDKPQSQVMVRASSNIPWQAKALKNLQRLMPSLILTYE